MSIQNYVPTLAIRVGEMNGLELLPGKSKTKMTPCFLLAPWVGAGTLERAIERVEKAFPKQHYFLDMDRDYQITNPDKPAQQEWNQLRNPANWKKWIEFIKKHEWIWPCVQFHGQSEKEIREQIVAIQELGRQYCMRIERSRFPDNLDEVISAFTSGGPPGYEVGSPADFLIILEGGWRNDPFELSSWFERLMSEELQKIDANVPVVLSCTSICKTFFQFNGISKVPIQHRQLVQSIGQKSNRARVIYGDWGSTRPREMDMYARRPFDRIDYPTEDAWYIVRNQNDGWDFNKAAKELIRSEAWNGKLNIWGEEMIRRTVINKAIGIDTFQKNIAARVNIHLHRQAFYGEPESDLATMDLDDDWED